MSTALANSTAGSDGAASSDDAANLRLRAEQIALLCRHSKSATISAALTAWYVCWLLATEHSAVKVAAWYALLLVISVVRFVIQQAFLKEHENGEVPKNLSRHSALIMIGVFLYGAVWSLPSTWLMLMDPNRQVMMTVFLVGLSAAGLTSLGPMRAAYSTFMVAFMLPIAVYYVVLGDNFLNVGIGIGVFLVAMVAAGHRSTQTIEDSLRLQLANAELAAREHREKAIVERANRDLELQIAQRERTEAELRVAKGEAEAANRAKNQFLANMSHELRTPLNGVLGTSDLLLRSLPDTPQLAKSQRYAQTIRGAGERLLHLINDILDMARIEAGAIRFENAVFDPRRLIADAVEAVGESCAEKNIELRADIAPDVPHEVRGDIYRLRQVLTNLLSNAVKFTDRGAITVRLRVTERNEDAVSRNARLQWSVVDTGIGISAQSRSRLFQPFSQIDDSFTRRFGGSGLGLAICKQIVTALKGRIDVESTPGSGSTFWFEVPLDLPDHEASIRASAALAASRSLGGTVLVVEDNETNSQLIVEMLELVGSKAHTASNGIEALEMLSHGGFDAVLMDWHMPHMDGLAATREWRSRESSQSDSRRLPIIALTASVLPGDRDECLKAGMDDFIAKPFTYDELVTVVAKWVPSEAEIRDSGIEIRSER